MPNAFAPPQHHHKNKKSANTNFHLSLITAKNKMTKKGHLIFWRAQKDGTFPFYGSLSRHKVQTSQCLFSPTSRSELYATLWLLPSSHLSLTTAKNKMTKKVI